MSKTQPNPPLPRRSPRPRPSILVLLLSLALLAAVPAAAQTVHRSPARQDADHRRALREAQRLESPYKNTHLQPGRRLRRGHGDHPRPEGSDEFRYENGNHPRVVQPVFPALRRKRKTQQ